MLDCTATGGRQGPNALPLTSCHLTVRNSILASGSGNSPVGSVSITATFPSWTRSLWRSRPSLPTGLNPIIRSDDYAQLLKTFSLEGLSCCDEAKLDSTKANRAATIAHGNLPFRASRLYICIPPHRRLGSPVLSIRVKKKFHSRGTERIQSAIQVGLPNAGDESAAQRSDR